MDKDTQEKLETRLKQLREWLPEAQAAYDREFDKDYDTPKLREAEERLDWIQKEIALIEEQLGTSPE